MALSRYNGKLFCSVFKSSKKAEMYVYVERSKGCKELPEALLTVFGAPLHVMDMVLTEEKVLARAKASEVLADISEKGFYLQMPPLTEEKIEGAVAAPPDILND